MAIFKSKFIGWVLLVAVGLASLSAGCQARAVRNPTFANFGSHLRDGNQVKLALKNGITRTARVTAIRTDGLVVENNESIAYGTMQEARRISNGGNPIGNTIDGLGCVIEPVCTVVYVVARVFAPFCR